MNSLTARPITEITPASRRDPRDTWCLIESSLDHRREPQAETLFTVANGALGIRGGLEEGASATQASFLAGVWERSAIHYHERHAGFAPTTDTRLPVADATSIAVRLGSVTLSPHTAECCEFERVLDFRLGRLIRYTRWRVPGCGTIEIEAERLAAFASPGLLCVRLRLRSVDYAGRVSLESAIFAGTRTPPQGADPRFGSATQARLRCEDSAADEGSAWLAQTTESSAIRLVCVQRHRASSAVHYSDSRADSTSAVQTFAAVMAPGQEICLDKYVCYEWTPPHAVQPTEDLLARANERLIAALDAGFERIAAAQAAMLSEFWRSAAVSVSGDPETERALRFNLFHVFQCASRDDRTGYASKGLTGQGYEGHVFWDAEIFLLPSLVFLAPELVRQGLLWRYRLLDRARAHAQGLNHRRGALYPWRTIGGDECSAHYPSGSAQYHINADIAYALRLYLLTTDDQDLLLNGGAEMLFETARIWVEVGHFNPRRGGAFCIPTVTGPDEYSILVDNNYFTNRMAQAHLRFAAEMAAHLQSTAPTAYAAIAARIDLAADEPGAWSRAAELMYLPYDSELGIVAQDDTFLDKPLWPAGAAGAERRPLLLQHHPMTLSRHQVCKQADALHALILAGEGIDAACKRRSFDYYARVTVHDSTLSAPIFSIAAAEVGYPAQALRFFRDALRVDLDNLHANTDHGLHMASAAGSWMAVVWGFGGLRVGADGTLAFRPVLPPGWSGYSFTLVWRQSRLRVEVAPSGVRYELQEGPALTVRHNGVSLELHPGALTRLSPVPPPVGVGHRLPAGAASAVIFDLDGVLTDTATLHYRAWKRLADELQIPFDERVNERLRGVDRMRSLEIILERAPRSFDAVVRQELAARKNAYFRQLIADFHPGNLFPGAREALIAARDRGVRVALASASHNAAALVERLGIASLFDHVVDPVRIARGKPAPDIFLAAAAALGVEPAACIGVEDAAAGVEAIVLAGMFAIGIGERSTLAAADVVVPNIGSLQIETYLSGGHPQ